MRGRKPDPGRGVRGTGHRPLPEVAAARLAALPEAPQPPERLPEAVRETWEEIVAAISPLGRLAPADRYLLESLACLVVALRQAQWAVLTDGMFLEGERGRYLNPAVNVAQKAATAIARLAEQFGGSPAARVRLGLAMAQRESLVATLERLAAQGGEEEAG